MRWPELLRVEVSSLFSRANGISKSHVGGQWENFGHTGELSIVKTIWIAV